MILTAEQFTLIVLIVCLRAAVLNQGVAAFEVMLFDTRLFPKTHHTIHQVLDGSKVGGEAVSQGGEGSVYGME